MTFLNDPMLTHLRNVMADPDFGGTKYTVLRRIGAGGMGAVFLAEDAELHRKVAIKIMNVSDELSQIARRTLQEAMFIAQLEHPGIVPIHDLGRLPDGRIFYVMKYIEGKRLDEVVREGAGQRELLRLFQKICDAIAFAHAQGVIHRDLKPENIMIGSFGEALVMDWGAAKMLAPAASHREESAATESSPGNSADTRIGTVIGTPGYMAPEQQAGRIEEQNARTDIYALGGVLHFILTATPPGQPRSPSETAMNLRRRYPSIPKPLAAMCAKALASEPNDRYAGVADLSADVTRYLDGLSVSAYRENFVEKSGKWLSRNQTLIWLIAAYLLMRVFVLLYFGR